MLLNKLKDFLMHRLKSYKHARNGMRIMIFTQINARIELIAALLVIVLGLIVSLSLIEWAVIAIAIGTVLISEIFNTAMEFLLDRISPQYSQLVKNIKDIAAAGVLLSVILAIVLGLLVFLPHFVA